MIPALLIAVSLHADGMTPPPMPSADGEILPTALAMYISVVEPSVIAGVGGLALAPISATVRAGAVVDGRHALLAGIAFGASFASSTDGVTLTFLPTYRYFLKPLIAGGFCPYVQAELLVGYTTASTAFGGSGTISFGFGGAFGAEFLVGRNFGLTAAAGMRFIHGETSGPGGGARSNAIGINASVGVALHF